MLDVRRNAFAVAVFALWSFAAAKTDRERAELRGPVKSVTVRWQADHKDRYGQIDERMVGVTTFDTNGALMRDQMYTPDFIKEKKPERHGAAETVFRSVMGNSIERYEFDARGNITVMRLWYSDSASGDPQMTERMKYDARDHIIERASFGPDGKRFAVTLFTRDSTGDVVTEESRGDDARPPYPRMHYTYLRDAHGNWTTRTVKRENIAEDDYLFRHVGNLRRDIVYFH